MARVMVNLIGQEKVVVDDKLVSVVVDVFEPFFVKLIILFARRSLRSE